MSKYNGKSKVRAAVQGKLNKFDLSCNNLTTANFLEVGVAYNRELIPRQKIKVDLRSFARFSPLTLPPLGSASIRNYAFFVPYRTVFPGWNDFINDLQHQVGSSQFTPKVPIISQDAIDDFIELTAVSSQTSIADSVADTVVINTYDFYTSATGTGRVGFTLTSFGRFSIKLLQQLGYNIAFGSGGTYSALPLLSFAKVFYDWFSNSAYVPDSGSYNILNELLTSDTSSGLNIAYGKLYNIMEVFASLVNYDSDVFTSAWDRPVQPNTSAQSSPVTLKDLTLGTSSSAYDLNVTSAVDASSNKYSTPVIKQGSNSMTNTVSQYMLDALKALSDYVKRHQLSGGRVLDRWLSRWGVTLEDAAMDRSMYLGKHVSAVQFDSVTAQGSGAVGPNNYTHLGDYAGKAMFYDDGAPFEFTADEFGQFIIVSSIIPNVSYYQGIDRHNLHLNVRDFFTPEYDNLGETAISKQEVYVSPNLASSTLYSYSAPFGFAPMYFEYKNPQSRISGDFRFNSAGRLTLEPFHFGRKFSDASFPTDASFYHSLAFTTAADRDQFNRIFQSDTNTIDNAEYEARDHIFIWHNVNVESWIPAKTLADTYDFKSTGEDVVIDSNGTKFN